MRRRSICLIKCIIGLTIAFIAISNCFNVMSNSETPPASPPDQAHIAHNSNRIDAGLNPVTSATRDRERLDAISSPYAAGMAINASALSPFVPAITATKSHTPSGSANPGDTLTYTVVIANTGTDATGVNFTDTIDPNTTLVPGSLKASPIAADDSYHTIGNVNISVPVAQGVTANDSNSGFGALSVTKVNATVVPPAGSATTSTANGSVTMNSDGSFSYTPNVAFRGPTDSFTYELDNGSGSTDTATVTISVNGLIWFVDSSAAPGDGRLSTPFNCLVGAGCFDPAAADIANDNIFVYSGAYTGGFALLGGQKLIGQGAGNTLLNISALAAPSGNNLLPSTGGANPVITASVNNITLGAGNTIRGVTLNVSAIGATALTGSGFGTLTLAETTLGGTNGRALNLTTGTLSGPVASTAAFITISSTNSSTTGISLTSVGGSMSSGTTTITNPTGIGVSVDTSSAALNFGTTSSVSSGGSGVSLTTNTGTITFGTLDISPDSGQRGLVATENTMTLTSTGGTISTTGATAVQISRSSGTTPLAIALTSVSASASPSNGVFLSGTSGSFTVDGDGTNTSVGGNGTGGTITGATGADGSTNGIAVYLNNVTNVTLRRVTINGANQNFGIYGTNANTVSLEYSTVSGTNGTNDLLNEGSIAFDGLFGSASLKNDNISGAWKDTVRVTNTTGTLNRLTVDNVTFGANNATFGNSALITSVTNTGVLNLTVQNSSFTSSRSTQLQYTMNAGTPSGDVLIDNNSFTDAQAQISGALGIFLTSGSTGNPTLTYHISNNTISGMNGTGISVGKGSGTGNFNGTITTNQVGTSGVSHSGGANGISLIHVGGGTNTMSVTNNTIFQFDTDGILLQDGSNTSGGNGTINATVTGNTIKEAFGAFPNAAFELNNGTTAADAPFVCLALGGAGALKNDFTTSPSSTPYGVNEVRLRMRFNSTTRLPGYGGANNDLSAVATFAAANNITTSGAASVTVNTSSPNGYVGGAACTPATASFGEVMISSVGKGGASRDLAGESDGILRAARGKAPMSDDSVQRLRQRDLNWIVQAAIERWRQADVSSEDLDRLQAASFEITDLPEGQIASAASSKIKIDETAAGYGWFFDQTPNEDSEFDVLVPGKELQTTELSPAHGKMDLLTAVMRELGRIYLEGTDRIPRNLRPLMEATISPATRRMPVFNIPDRSSSRLSPGAGHSLNGKAIAALPLRPASDSSASPIPAVFNPSADLMPGSYAQRAKRMSYAASATRVALLSPFSGETVNLSVGTIPAGESVTITFQVTVDNPFPNGVCNVTNQGHVTGSNFSQVDTNIDVTPINKAVTISACPANITTNTDAGVCTAVVTFTTPTGDGCPTPTVTCNPTSGSAFAKGTTTVTCTATNGNPPDATCTFTVTVNDTQAPTITCPAGVTQGTDAGVCTAVVTYTNATATDNCPGVGTPVCTPASGTAFNKGTTTVNCTVSDASSNSANCSFTVTVNDTTPPTISCPANVTKSTDPNVCTAVVTYPNATASDNCPGVGTPVCTPSSGSTFVKGVTTVTCTVSDSSSNSANCSFTVTVKDTQAPNLGPCPSNISVTSSGGCQVVNYTPPTATDNCGSATVTCSPASGTCFPPGTTTVTCTASDTSPDSPDSSCSFTVTVVPCAITCPANITVGNDAGQCGATVTYSPNTNGGCGTIVCSPSSGSFFLVGTTTVMCTTSAGPSCSFTVTVNDTEGPHITVTTQPIELWPPNHHYHTITMSDLVASATDNCSGNLINSVVIASVSSDEPENSSGSGNTLNDIVIAANCKSVDLRAEREGGGNGRVYTIVLRVKDAAGNIGTASRTVTVPANQGGGPAILGPGPGYTVNGTCP